MATHGLAGYNPHRQGSISRLRENYPFGILRGMAKTLVDRIDERLRALGITGEEASKNAGMHRDTIRDLKRGKRKTLNSAHLAALAQSLGTTANWLLGTELARYDSTDEGKEFGVQYGGIVEAGAFRPQNFMDQETTERVLIPVAPDGRYPANRQYCFKVVGNSMDQAKIFEGMYVVSLDVNAWEQRHGEVPDGKLVVVKKSNLGEAACELTVKRLRIFRDRIELRPESSDSRHETYVYPLPPTPDDTRQVEVVAVVLNATWLYE